MNEQTDKAGDAAASKKPTRVETMISLADHVAALVRSKFAASLGALVQAAPTILSIAPHDDPEADKKLINAIATSAPQGMQAIEQLAAEAHPGVEITFDMLVATAKRIFGHKMTREEENRWMDRQGTGAGGFTT